ncbi:MAG: DNA cytosine methyltransferase [Cyclobacteriaceae bacterium]|nr:DNA cytosine methyltransferase [Cyclobacteriaceae bacterium]
MSDSKYIDLFAGAGGLSEGFLRAGFNPIAHVERDEAASFTLRTRAAYYYLIESKKEDIYFKYLKGEINRKELYASVPDYILNSIINKPIGPEYNSQIHSLIEKQLDGGEVDLIIGGPPCQAYSVVGRARSANNMKGDSRNYLYLEYANYLERYRPKMFVFENVMGLRSAGGGVYLENMKRIFDEKGYSFTEFYVNASDYGVLQNRKRILIVGWIKDFVPNISDLSNPKINLSGKVNDIFEDLPTVKDGDKLDKFRAYANPKNNYLNQSGIRNGVEILTQHITRPHNDQDKEIYKIAVDKWSEKKERLSYNDLPDRLKTHNNQHSFLDRFKVVGKDESSSQTVVAHIAKDGHYYIHPDLDQNRSISVREAARLQSFPDDFYFEGVREGANRTAAFKQIGNAVPPLMAEKIAKYLKPEL